MPRWQLRADGVGSVIMYSSHPPPLRGGGHFAFQMHLNPVEQGEGITIGFAGLQGGGFGTAGLASACALLGFCFGPQRVRIEVEWMLQTLCATFGFCFGLQTAGMAAQSTLWIPHPGGTLLSFPSWYRCFLHLSPSSSPVALEVECAYPWVQASLKGSLDLSMLLWT